MTIYRAKKDDNNALITVILVDSLGPVNLDGCSVAWIMRDHAGVVTIIDAVPDADQAAKPGMVSVTLTSAHLATADIYNVEWQVTCGVDIITYPNSGYDRLIVLADLN